jgi:hypothetical protein
MIQPTPGPCGCYIRQYEDENSDGPGEIIYCPTHAAAPELRAIIQRLLVEMSEIMNIVAGHINYDVIAQARALLARLEGPRDAA